MSLQFVRRFQSLFILGCILALAGGVAYLIYKADDLASLQETTFQAAWSSFHPHHLGALYDISHAWRRLLVDWLPGHAETFLSAERTAKIEYALFTVLALIDLSRARVSHAAAATFAPAFGVLMNFIHLLFKDVWIGGIIALVVLLSPIMKKARRLASGRVRAHCFFKNRERRVRHCGSHGSLCRLAPSQKFFLYV